MNTYEYDRKVQQITHIRMNSVSLIIVQLLIFITYTVKIVSESFAANVSFEFANNQLMEKVMFLLITSIVILILTLIPMRENINFEVEKQVSSFNKFCKFQSISYTLGFYLMLLGVYLIFVIILVSIGLTSLGFQLLMLVCLSLIVFLLIKSLVEHVLN